MISGKQPVFSFFNHRIHSFCRRNGHTALLSLLYAALIVISCWPLTIIAEQGVVPHPKGCTDDEIYISSQDWWLTTPGEVGQDG